MPTYTITNTEGVTLKIVGDKPPTKEQLDNIFSEYNQQKIQTAPVQETLTDQIKLTEEVVKKNPKWIEASKSIYKWNEGVDAPNLKTDKDYAEYGLDYMGKFNYNLPQMTVEATQLKDATDVQKQDFITLMDMYDKKSASWAGAGRLFKGLATDPTTYIGATTLGVGTAGAQAVKQAIKEGVKQGTKAGLKQGAKIGSMEGAVYATADNALRQTARINAGVQEDFNLGESAKAATVGATAGAGLGGVIGGIGTNIAARSKLSQIAQREEPTLQKENVDLTNKVDDNNYDSFCKQVYKSSGCKNINHIEISKLGKTYFNEKYEPASMTTIGTVGTVTVPLDTDMLFKNYNNVNNSKKIKLFIFVRHHFRCAKCVI